MIKSKDLGVYRKAINEALSPVGQKYGIEFSCGSAEFTDYNFVFKLKGIVKSEEVNGEKEIFNQRAVIYGFNPDDYGREFTYNGIRFRFIGFNDRARVNNCIILRLEDNKKFTAPSNTLHSVFEKNQTSDIIKSGTPEKAGQWNPAASLKTVTFFVAECMEMYNMGEYHENLTVQNAVARYNAIPSERMNAIKGIGVALHEGGQPSATDAHYDLMSLGVLDLDILEDAGEDRPHVQYAFQKLRNYLDKKGIHYTIKNVSQKEMP